MDQTHTLQVLLIEDNPGDARLVREFLSEDIHSCFHITPITCLADIQAAIIETDFDAVLLDLTLPDAQGLKSLAKTHELLPEVPIVVMSGLDDEPLSIRAVQAGAQDYLIKGAVDARLLTRTLYYAIERNRLRLELASVNKRQEYLATHDILTGLPNRQLLTDRLNQSIAEATRYSNFFALLFLDVDGFKTINDSFGHDRGDELLKAIAERLKNCVRKTDTIARLGGDEFIIILTRLTNPKVAGIITQTLLERLTEPFRLFEHELFISASVGISIFPNDGSTPDVLLKNADAAMYHAKESGKNTFRYYTAEMNASSHKQITLGNSLRRALENKELFLVFQPQINVQTHHIVGLEALTRWKHPELGFVPPSEFIPLAEETGLIVPLGEWIVRAACEQYRHWQELGLPKTRIIVNFSARQFEQPQFLSNLFKMLNETNMPPEYFGLELTESTVMKDPEEVIQILKQLKEIGIHVAIDDFGTGYSSLSYLQKLPIDTLKIDRSFIRDIALDPSNVGIARAIIALSNSLNLEVIAEGVETPAQQHILQAEGCHLMQGYLFSRPLLPNDCFEFIKNQPEDPLAKAIGG